MHCSRENCRKLDQTELIKKSKWLISEYICTLKLILQTEVMTQGHLKTQICIKNCSKRADCSFQLFRSVPIFVTDYTVPFLWPPPKRGGGACMLWDRDGSHLHTNATTTGHVSTPKHPWWVIVNDVTIYTEFYLIKLDINQFKSKFRKVQQFGTRLTLMFDEFKFD